MKSFLFVLRKPAHSGAYLQEMLDIILTTAAFDQQVSILLLDDAVFALKNNQHPESVGLKDSTAIFKALESYDVYDIYVETETLWERGLTADKLTLTVTELGRNEIAKKMQQFDIVFAG
jgi:tRNA 2-thiouridine synthesizing protein C